jgi:CheY-like chemotaxis protein
MLTLNGGAIGVHSEGAGRGSTFFIEIPVYEQSIVKTNCDPLDELCILRPSDSTLSFADGPINADHMKSVRLLVVDDSAVSRRMVAKLLRQNFRDVSEASDGVEALRLYAASCAANDPFGVIMLDNQMPNMDGPDCATELRKLGFSGALIGLTGYGDRDQLDSFMKTGVDNVITKPLNHQRFLRMLSSTYLIPYTL